MNLKENLIKSDIFIYLAITILACILIALGCRRSVDSGAGADPTDLLPVNNDISGFTKKGSAAIMKDEQSIFDAIDGAAGKYIDYGFVEGVQQMYTNVSIDIDVQILNQGSQANAEGIFQDFLPSSPEWISNNNPQAVIEHALLTGYIIYYTRENIFMQIHTFDKSNYALNMAKQFVWNIDMKITSG